MNQNDNGGAQASAEGTAAAEPEVEIVGAASRGGDRQQERRAEPERDEGEEYSRRVQKRIGAMTGRLRTEESRRITAETEAAQLRAALAAERAHRYGDREKSIGSELTAAEQDLAKAITDGDPAKQAAANRRLAELGAERGHVAAGKSQAEQHRAQAEQLAKQAPQANQVSDPVQSWIDDGNDWFLSNPDMHADAVLQHHAALRQKITVDSPEYFAFIDQRMRRLHPDFFAGEPGGESGQPEPSAARAPSRQAAPTVAARRDTPRPPAPPRKIQLTSDEMDVVKALGITPQQYAAERDKLNKKGS